MHELSNLGKPISMHVADSNATAIPRKRKRLTRDRQPPRYALFVQRGFTLPGYQNDFSALVYLLPPRELESDLHDIHDGLRIGSASARRLEAHARNNFAHRRCQKRIR